MSMPGNAMAATFQRSSGGKADNPGSKPGLYVRNWQRAAGSGVAGWDDEGTHQALEPAFVREGLGWRLVFR